MRYKMSSQYDVVMQIQLQGPTNLGSVTKSIEQQLKGINANVNINTSSAVTGTSRLRSGLDATTVAMRNLQAQSNATSTGLTNITVAAGRTGDALESIASQGGTALRRLLGFTI